MNKHTPGPWLIERDKVGPRIESDGQDDGMMMPVAYIEKFDYPDQYQANARLIAAAPDLLEALEELKCELILSDVDIDYIESHFRKAINKAQSAIDRARGEV